jgi:RNA polymerase sigma-70 factor, ECF subfamily
MRNLSKRQTESSSDDELMKAIVNRDSGALETIYKRYESLVRTVILGVVRDESEVDDVLTEVLTQIWQRANRYNSNHNGLRGLMVTLARRRAFDRLRRKDAYQRATEGLKAQPNNPLSCEISSASNAIEIQDLSQVLGRVIRQLPQAQQEVIDLSFFKGMSQREIAAERKISLGTVKTRLHLAQKKLYQSLFPIQSKI